MDTDVANIVLKLNYSYPMITLECAIPCETQAVNERNIYYDLLSKSNKETLLQQKYTSNCIQKENEYMVDNSDYVIAVWNGKPSGTDNTVKHSMNNNKMVLLVNPQTLVGLNSI